MKLQHADLIGKMTLDEKVSLLSGKDFWQTQNIARLNIPSAFLSDGPNGLRKQVAAADHLGLNPSIPATCMPTSASSANSWDTALLYEDGKTIGEEAKAAKVSVLLGPGTNIKRNPRCGRNFEYFAEDPYLAGKMASAFIQGVQSNGVISCVKHFACNDQETRRMSSDSVVDERALREIYLTAFEIAVKEGHAGAVMSAYNRLNGFYCNENRHLLVDILRKDWGFKGLVITDWGGENDRVEGLKCTNELEMPSTQGETACDIKEALKSQKIFESDIDSAVDRLIDAVLRTHEAIKDSNGSFDKEAHHAVAQKVEEGSIVLLKNEDGILPLKPKSKVAIIGDFAKKPRYQGAGSSIVNPLKVDSILGCVRQYDLNVVGYAPGFERYGKSNQHLISEALKVAEKSDVVLAFVGLDEWSEAEGLDRKNIRLPDNQRELISALYHLGKPIVAIISAGSVIEVPFVDRVAALVDGYLGGEAGAKAMMNVLTGKVNPSGKLAETYPLGYPDVPSADHFGRNSAEVEYREGIYVGYRYFLTNGIQTRFPFGYGLSYTVFSYKNLTINEKGAHFSLTNAGKVKGKEIAQLYIGLSKSKVFRPLRELKGFAKIELEPGETKEIDIPFDDKSFRYFNVKTNQWERETGDYSIEIGASSADIRLSGKWHVEGTTDVLPYDKKTMPSYFSGHVRTVSDEEFSVLLGHPVEKNAPIANSKKRVVVGYETCVADLRYAKGWFGRFFERVIRHAVKLLPHIGHRSDANSLTMGVYFVPMRNLSRMSGGIIGWRQLDGLILMFNGHFFKGLHKFFKEGRIKNKKRKAEVAALKAAGSK